MPVRARCWMLALFCTACGQPLRERKREAQVDYLGGRLPKLEFAIIGASAGGADAHKLWQSVQNESARPPFAIVTHTPCAAEQVPNGFTDPVFFADTACRDIPTPAAWSPLRLLDLLQPPPPRLPYYALRFTALDGTWTAKFVFWSGQPSTEFMAWLEHGLAQPTTYTFIVQPDVPELLDASLPTYRRYPTTLILAGQGPQYLKALVAERRPVKDATHGHVPAYVIARQQADGAMLFTSYGYDTHAVTESFAVHADGSSAKGVF